MRAQKFNLAIIAICVVVLVSCTPESQITSGTAIASISDMDRYMYVGSNEAMASDKFLILLNIDDISSSEETSKNTSTQYSESSHGTNHIGPYQIEESFSIEESFWNLESAIIAWVYSIEN